MDTIKTKVCRECGRELEISKFKMMNTPNYKGPSHICLECSLKHHREKVAGKLQEEVEKLHKQELKESKLPFNLNDKTSSNTPLSSFTPRQLMQELYSRGYKGELTFTCKVDLASM